ncbi:FecR family protein [Kordiimonas aestuarii]|uniref:FecR family protein n=1 Tax=Kordiimonas aestuarii TaxID=1005925 RepID=UPI0021D3281A|nr:FecR domain-containing protein [Kordiimonas aestuarii]
MMTMNERLDINEQAIAWVSKLLGGTGSDADKHAYADWKEKDKRHAAASHELDRLLVDFDAAGKQALEDEMVRELEAAAAEKTRRRFFAGVSSIAAAFIAAVMITITMWSPVPEAQLYQTAIGERSTVTLEDGSKVQLNTGTRISVVMQRDERHITIDGGEAFFDVTRDESRPFVVTAGKSEVRVLGTKFSVRLGASSNVISVLSGLVSVAQHQDGDGESREVARLTAGQQVVHAAAIDRAVVDDFDESSVFAWRTGKAFYSETPLAEVVTDLNRYFDDPLEIADVELASLPVSGTFNLNNQDVVIDALESAFSIMAVKRVDGVILLYARQED